MAPVTTFSTKEDAIRQANATEYGLAAYLYGRDFNRLLRVAEQIDSAWWVSMAESSPTQRPLLAA